MKQKLLILALMIALGTIVANAQSKHRHHVAPAAPAPVTATATPAPDDADEGIEAFSDTTSLAGAGTQADAEGFDDMSEEESTTVVSHDPDDYDNLFSWLESFHPESLGLFGSILGFLIAVFVVLLIVLVLLGPIILLIMVMRYLIRSHNDRVTLAEKAMESGRPIPEELLNIDRQSDEFLNRRGIRNIWIGIGMIIMFGIWDSSMLQGVGALVLCYGIGQLIIARSSRNKNREKFDKAEELFDEKR